MSDFSFLALGFGDLVIAGPYPFNSNSTPNSSTYNVTTLQVAPWAQWQALTMTDNDLFLEDGDSGQNLTQPLTINGNTYSINQNVEIEYSYVIRPVGSNDPADNITIYVLEFGSSVQGIATNQPLDPDLTYRIISGQNNPSVLYSDLVICFTPGTAIATPGGPVAVEKLRRGDLVCTVDNGPQPLIWRGARIAAGLGSGMPVRVAAGVLGNDRPLLLSQQHRVLVPADLGLGPDVIVPVKALVGLSGVRFAPCRLVQYIHLMCDRHELIFAEGAQAESFLPGPQALRSLTRQDRTALHALKPTLRQKQWPGVRPMMRAGQARRAMVDAGCAALIPEKSMQGALPTRMIAPLGI